MVERVSETARATPCACVVAPAVSGRRILMFHMIIKHNRDYAKTRIEKCA
jgi:hypothetical protein